MNDFPAEITVGEKYNPAMEITDQAEADEYWERCVRHRMNSGVTRAEAERVERINFGYYAGYFSVEVRTRVERLFRCAHPYFGPIATNGRPTQGEASAKGVALGQHMRDQ